MQSNGNVVEQKKKKLKKTIKQEKPQIKEQFSFLRLVFTEHFKFFKVLVVHMSKSIKNYEEFNKFSIFLFIEIQYFDCNKSFVDE